MINRRDRSGSTDDDIIRIKGETDIRSVADVQKVYVSLRLLIMGIIVGTLWFARLEYNLYDMNKTIIRNRTGLEYVWSKVFGYQMPP